MCSSSGYSIGSGSGSCGRSGSCSSRNVASTYHQVVLVINSCKVAVAAAVVVVVVVVGVAVVVVGMLVVLICASNITSSICVCIYTLHFDDH